MGGFIIRQGYSREDVIRDRAAFWAYMQEPILRAVEQSFFRAGVRSPTHAMIKERVVMCEKIVKVCRYEKKPAWSKFRIRDCLLELLEAELLGMTNSINPDTLDKGGERGAWINPDGMSAPKIVGDIQLPREG